MIIAFTGKKQTGKSTACAYLEEKYGFTRVNFKDALVAEIKQNFPELLVQIAMDCYRYQHIEDLLKFEPNYLEQLFQEKPPLVRTLLQNYGTNVRRNDDEYYWTNKWRESVSFNAIEHQRVTVDDCRFLNEAATVRAKDGIIIRLVRTDMQHTDTHISETEMDLIYPDFTIVCNGNDHEYLYQRLEEILKELN